MAVRMNIPTPADFSYQATVGSHGWLSLDPFSYSDANGILSRIHQLDDGKVVRLNISDAAGDRTSSAGLVVTVDGSHSLTKGQQAQVSRDVRLMFSLDWDLGAFYGAMRGHTGYEWIAQQKLGRMLVTPTVWEDLAKTLLTTNTTWSQTKKMVAQLCALGKQYAPDQFAFPTVQRIAELSPDALAQGLRAGYRTAYLHTLAQAIASGKLNVETWRTLPTAELYKALKGIHGFGDYAAGTMLRLLARFDRLAIDTECRASYKRITGSETATDAEIRAYYEPFGDWRGLVMWINIMRE